MTGWRSGKEYFKPKRFCSKCFTTETTRWNKARDGIPTPDSLWCQSCYKSWYNDTKHDYSKEYEKKLRQRVSNQNRQLRHQIKLAQAELQALKDGVIDTPLERHPHKRHVPTSVDILKGIAERERG
jgi:hypothetical protein